MSSNNEAEEGEPQVQMVHKLQKAVAQSRQRLQKEEASATVPTRESGNHESHEIIEAREQRSHIAIIQMAPPAPGSLSRTTAAASSSTTSTTGKSGDVPLPAIDEPKVDSSVPVKTITSSVSGAAIGVQGPQKGDAAASKKKRHHCSVHGCTYSTPHTKDLARHMRKHTGEKPYSCDRCSKGFTRYDKLVQHIRTHEGHRPFACHLCSHAATDSSSLKKHLRTHDDTRPYKCQLCDYASKDQSQLVVHLRRHTGDCPYTCSFSGCDAAFKTPSDLSRHTRLHTGLKPYKCSYCDYRAAVKCNLNAHMKRHLNPGSKKNGRRKAKTVTPVVLNEEAESARNETDHSFPQSLPFSYACKFCDFKADSIDQFCIHMKEAHQNTDPETGSPQKSVGRPRTSRKPRNFMDQKNFSCTNCTAAFVCEESLRCHMHQHDAVPNRPANVSPEVYTPNMTFLRTTSSSVTVENADNFTELTTTDNSVVNNTHEITLHEMQRMPLPHGSVITENPAVVNYTPPLHHEQLVHQHPIRYEIAANQEERFFQTYAYQVPENLIAYRNHSYANIEYHEIHDAS